MRSEEDEDWDDDEDWIECWDCGGEGGQDGDELMEEDPFWYGPDDFETCDTCHGKGWLVTGTSHRRKHRLRM